MEILKIAEPRPLIDPSQVVVTKGEIFVADPVLTPIGNGKFSQVAMHACSLFLVFDNYMNMVSKITSNYNIVKVLITIKSSFRM